MAAPHDPNENEHDSGGPMPSDGDQPYLPSGFPAVEALPELLLLRSGLDPQVSHGVGSEIEEGLRRFQPGSQEDTPAEAVAWLTRNPDRPAAVKPATRVRKLALTAVLLSLFALALEFWAMLPDFTREATLAMPVSSGPRLVTPPPSVLSDLGELQIYRVPGARADNPLLPGRGRPEVAAEAFWKLSPDEPARYYYYSSTAVTMDAPLPDGYAETWQRLDPGNAIWPLLQARSVLMGQGIYPNREPGAEEEVDRLLREAARQPRFVSYESGMERFLDAWLIPPVTVGQMAGQINLVDRSMSVFGWLELSKTLRERSDDLAGTPEEAARYRALASQVDDLAAAERYDDVARKRGFVEWGSAATVVKLRLLLVTLGAGLLLVAAVLGFQLVIPRGAAGHLARAARRLLRPEDERAVVAAFMVVLVAFLMMAAAAVYEFSSHHRSLASSETLLSSFYPLYSVVFWLRFSLGIPVLVVMTEIARRRVSRRTALIGLRSGGFQRATGVVQMLVSVLPWAGTLYVLSMMGNSPSPATLLSGAGAILVLLWLVVKFISGCVFRRACMRHQLIAVLLIPALLTASILLSGVALTLHPVERVLFHRAVRNAKIPPEVLRVSREGE